MEVPSDLTDRQRKRIARHEAALAAYFRAWLEKDPAPLGILFAPDIVYTECYGPVYCGLDQVRRWFADWNRDGAVLEWPIRRFIHQGGVTVAEWFFRCEYKGEPGAFDGVSIVEFDTRDRIVRLNEFQSKTGHVYPYGQPRMGGNTI